MSKFTFLIIYSLLLAACATIPEDQCAKVDWFELGVQDGRAGHEEDRLNRHREACAGVKIFPDEKRYMEGRKIGLTEYCQPENAVREGLAGRYYRGVCNNEGFRRLHQAAYKVYSLKQNIKSNLDDISRKESELRNKDTSEARRKELHSEIRDLDRRRESLRDDLYRAEQELDRVRK